MAVPAFVPKFWLTVEFADYERMIGATIAAAKICRKACDSMPEATHPQPRPPSGMPVLLDTHVVLDWFWFGDPRVSTLSADVISGSLRWLASPAMRAELERVLNRLPLIRNDQSREHVLTSMAIWSALVDAAVLPAAPRVSDPDDQMFVDLALQARAAVLFTRDRALLRLKSRLARDGCIVTTPEAYAAGAGQPVRARILSGT